MSDFFSTRNLNITFQTEAGAVNAVQNLNLVIPKGRTVGLVGESGSGKSVTSLSLMRLLPKTASITGDILFEGIRLLELPESEMRQRRGRDIAMVFQDPMSSLNPVFTVGDQIAEVLRVHRGMSKSEARQRTLGLLEEVGIPKPEQRIKAYPHEMSGGQRQRVMIAMAIACEPKLLIADEPTTALDVTIQKQILELLKKLQAKYGMSMLFITHDLGVIHEMADDVYVMYRGLCVEHGKARDVFMSPQHPYTQGLLNCRPDGDNPSRRLATVRDFMNEDGSAKSFDLRTLGSKAKATPPPAGAPLLEVRHMSKHYPIKSTLLRRTIDSVKAVDDVSFQLHKGRVLGLVGESGCGKTTLGRSLLRLIEPTQGEILYNGQDLTRLGGEELRRLRRKIQIVFQDPYSSLNPRLSIGTALTEPMKIHNIGANYQERWELAEQLMIKVGLDPRMLRRYPHEFSGGQRQRICIARALSVQPEFIVCDESVSALDVSVQAQILNLLLDLKEEFKLTYIFISHDLSVVRFFADEVAVMSQGKIVDYGSAEKVYTAPESDYTKKLLASIPRLAARQL